MYVYIYVHTNIFYTHIYIYTSYRFIATNFLSFILIHTHSLPHYIYIYIYIEREIERTF